MRLTPVFSYIDLGLENIDRIRKMKNKIIKMKNNIFAIPTAAVAMPLNPDNAVINAMIKNAIANLSMTAFHWLYKSNQTQSLILRS
jgi:hypothetical protein